MSNVIAQDQIEKKKMKIYKHKELKPERDGNEREAQNHVGAYPRKISLKSGIQKIISSCSKNKKRIKYE